MDINYYFLTTKITFLKSNRNTASEYAVFDWLQFSAMEISDKFDQVFGFKVINIHHK